MIPTSRTRCQQYDNSDGSLVTPQYLTGGDRRRVTEVLEGILVEGIERVLEGALIVCIDMERLY